MESRKNGRENKVRSRKWEVIKLEGRIKSAVGNHKVGRENKIRSRK